MSKYNNIVRQTRSFEGYNGYDHSVSLEDYEKEIEELSASIAKENDKIKAAYDDLEIAQEAAEAITEQTEILEKAINEDEVNESLVTSVESSIASILKISGLEEYKERTYSLENYRYSLESYAKVSLEEDKGILAKIWDGIKAFFGKIKEWIVSAWNAIKNMFVKLWNWITGKEAKNEEKAEKNENLQEAVEKSSAPVETANPTDNSSVDDLVEKAMETAGPEATTTTIKTEDVDKNSTDSLEEMVAKKEGIDPKEVEIEKIIKVPEKLVTEIKNLAILSGIDQRKNNNLKDLFNIKDSPRLLFVERVAKDSGFKQDNFVPVTACSKYFKDLEKDYLKVKDSDEVSNAIENMKETVKKNYVFTNNDVTAAYFKELIYLKELISKYKVLLDLNINYKFTEGNVPIFNLYVIRSTESHHSSLVIEQLADTYAKNYDHYAKERKEAGKLVKEKFKLLKDKKFWNFYTTLGDSFKELNTVVEKTIENVGKKSTEVGNEKLLSEFLKYHRPTALIKQMLSATQNVSQGYTETLKALTILNDTLNESCLKIIFKKIKNKFSK